MENLELFFILLFGHFVGHFVLFNSIHIKSTVGQWVFNGVAYALAVTTAFVFGVTTLQVEVPFLAMSAAVLFAVFFVTYLATLWVGQTLMMKFLDHSRHWAANVSLGFNEMLQLYVLLAAAVWFI